MKTLREVIPEVYKAIGKKYLHIFKKKYTWSDTKTQNTTQSHCLAQQDMLKLLIWRLRNQYLLVGNILIKQVVGVGQGDNHSGHVCRLYTIIRERRFQLKWEKLDINVARAFNNTTRKHDDYCFINNPYIPQLIHDKKNLPGLLQAQLDQWRQPHFRQLPRYTHTYYYQLQQSTIQQPQRHT